jgi:hypothetical protein
MCSKAREAPRADADKLAKTITDVPIIIGTTGAPRIVTKATAARAPDRISTNGT